MKVISRLAVEGAITPDADKWRDYVEGVCTTTQKETPHPREITTTASGVTPRARETTEPRHKLGVSHQASQHPRR